MRVLIDDGMQIQVATGIGKYSEYLYETLSLSKEIDIKLFQFDKGGASKINGRLKYLCFINSKKYLKTTEKYEILHYTNYVIPIRRNLKCRYVVTIHDLVAFLHPHMLPPVYRVYSRLTIRYSIKHADIVITVSESVKNEIETLFPKYANKVYVAYPGFYDEFDDLMDDVNHTPQHAFNLDILNSIEVEHYFLFIGTIEKRKNIGFVIDAFLKLKEYRLDNDYKLILAGQPGFGYEEFIEQVNKSKFEKDVIFTGYISTSDCKTLYRNATAYIFPSVYEGFGSTQLECMANHVPLILSDIPTNREVSGEYGFFFDLDDLESLVAQMQVIINYMYSKSELNDKADDILKKFSWKKLIDDYISAYRSVK